MILTKQPASKIHSSRWIDGAVQRRQECGCVATDLFSRLVVLAASEDVCRANVATFSGNECQWNRSLQSRLPLFRLFARRLSHGRCNLLFELLKLLFGLAEFGNIYSRLMNPTNDVLEKRLAEMDGGAAALTLASGQAAITAALLTICHSGQNFVSSTSLYGGTWTLFTQTFKSLGIEVRFFDPNEPEQINELVDENTRCVYFESIGNPKNDVPDFKKICDIAHEHGVPTLCDNTVMTPMLLRPIEHGVDIVIYSTTKFIGGHGVHIGGAIIDSGNFPWADDAEKWPEFCAPSPSYHGAVFEEALRPVGNIAYVMHIRTHWLRDTGAAMSPFAAFLCRSCSR